jgi:hypothetical protein
MSFGHFRNWHETDMPTTLRDVRFQGQSGKHVLVRRFSAFDPMYGPDDNLLVALIDLVEFHLPLLLFRCARRESLSLSLGRHRISKDK